MSRFKKEEREAIADFHTSLKKKVQREMYFLSLIGVNKASKRPEDDAKKHRDYKYTYKVIILPFWKIKIYTRAVFNQKRFHSKFKQSRGHAEELS